MNQAAFDFDIAKERLDLIYNISDQKTTDSFHIIQTFSLHIFYHQSSYRMEYFSHD